MMQVQFRPHLAERTTLRLGGYPLAEVFVEEEQDWEELPGVLKRLGGTPLALGRGSNVLASNGELPLVLITLKRQQEASGPEKRDRDVVRVRGGQSLPGLLVHLKRLALSGLEGLAGIPGTVGGAVTMNAGSYGCTLGEHLERVQLWTPEHGLFWLKTGGVKTGYRFFEPNLSSGFWIVTGAELRLKPGDPEAIRQKMKRIYLQKKTTQPILSRTCGCVFKNPRPGYPAGQILESCGLRGARIGDMGFSETHANFLVNHGRGTPDQAKELIETARERCRKRFGFELELEVRVLGD